MFMSVVNLDASTALAVVHETYIDRVLGLPRSRWVVGVDGLVNDADSSAVVLLHTQPAMYDQLKTLPTPEQVASAGPGR